MNKTITKTIAALSFSALLCLIMGCAKSASKTAEAEDNDTIPNASPSSEENADNNAQSPSFDAKTTVVIEDSIKCLHYNLTVEIPYEATKALSNSVWTMAIGTSFNDDIESFYKKEMEDYYNRNFEFEDEEEELYSSYQHEFAMRIANKTNRTVTYERFVYEFTGGVHGNSSLAYVMFDKESGNKIDNLLKDGITAKDLQDYIVKGLKKYFEVETEEDLREILFSNASEGDIPLPINPPALVNDSVIFAYDRYEIAPYAAGHPQISIPLSEIKDLVNDVF